MKHDPEGKDFSPWCIFVVPLFHRSFLLIIQAFSSLNPKAKKWPLMVFPSFPKHSGLFSFTLKNNNKQRGLQKNSPPQLLVTVVVDAPLFIWLNYTCKQWKTRCLRDCLSHWQPCVPSAGLLGIAALLEYLQCRCWPKQLPSVNGPSSAKWLINLLLEQRKNLVEAQVTWAWKAIL